MSKKALTTVGPEKETGPHSSTQDLFKQYVVPSYGRFDLAFARGAGSYLWDEQGRKYLDLGAGIAVCALGHSHPRLAKIIGKQAANLVHISNLYFHRAQGRFAKELVQRIGAGKCFFCNSGAEANEGLYKLARKFGHDEGRFEIITAINSFHGRTLAGITATGQEKVKKGFEPLVPGFRHVPYNDLNAVREALSPATVAILIEGVQGEGGVTPAKPEYLTGLRQLCNEKNLLLLMDEVQCGYYRTGAFVSFQRILEGHPEHDSFLPDGISFAKGIAGGFPMGAFWVRQPYADLLGPGTHASTFGGTPLACVVALEVLNLIKQEEIEQNVRSVGEEFKGKLQELAQTFPQIVREVRGLGFMLGMELSNNIPAFAGKDKSPALLFVNELHAAGLLAVPAGAYTIRFLPPLNLTREEMDEGLAIVLALVKRLAQ